MSFNSIGNRRYSNAEYFFYILNVKEIRINKTNYRIAFSTSPGTYTDYQGYSLQIYKEDNRRYNYIDEGNIGLSTTQGDYFFDNALKEFTNEKIPKLIVYDKICEKMRDDVNEILNENQLIISASVYRFYKERVENFNNNTECFFDEREQQIITQYKKLLTEGKTIKIQDVFISKNKIEIKGQLFKMEFSNKFIDIVQHFGQIKKIFNNNDIKYNFNMLYEHILSLSKLNVISRDNAREQDYKEFKGASFRINGMKICVYKDANRMKINGIFCRIDDVYYILTKTICYRNVKDYNKYIKDVSHIGVEWMKLINNGVLLELRNPFYAIFEKTGDGSFEKIQLRFSLFWDKDHRQKIHMLLNNKKYLIRYKAKFKKHFNFPSRVLSMSTLQNELGESLEKLDNNIILDIVENALEEAKIIKKRGRELVLNTMKEVNAKKLQMDINGVDMIGYKFKGRISKTEYFVKDVGLDVFKFQNGSWDRRCVVDDHTKQRIYEDKLANRLVNIYNEPKKIYTLHN